LSPPISYIPKGNWYCEFCVRTHKLFNKLEKPDEVVFPEYYQKVEKLELEKNLKPPKSGRNHGSKQKEPKFNKVQEKWKLGRKERAEKRRLIELGEKGSLARRRRFRVREKRKKKRKKKEERDSGASEERRRSKRSSLKKCIEKIKKGVRQLDGRTLGSEAEDNQEGLNFSIKA
jgi:hypothetical protein